MPWQEWVNLVAAFLVAGPVTMFLVQIIKNQRWPDIAKVALALVVAVMVGLAEVWVSGEILGLIGQWGTLTAADFIAVFGSVFAGAQAFYKLFQETQVMLKLAALNS